MRDPSSASLTRREFVRLAAGSALLATPLGALAVRRTRREVVPATSRQPNIILVTVDTLRADHVGAYGYSKPITPNIDRLAAQGILFKHAVSTAPWTFPSFSALHTSMYPTELGISAFNIPLSQIGAQRLDIQRTTLAEMLHGQGYRTQAIVTNPWLFPEFGFAQGFDGYHVVDREHANDYDAILANTLLGRTAERSRLFGDSLQQVYEAVMGPSGRPAWEVGADRVTHEAVSWLRENHDNRLFLWVHYTDPHYPYWPPADYRPTIPGVTPERLQYLGSYNELAVYDGQARLRPIDKQAIVELYDGEIAFLDRHVGVLLDEIDQLDLRNNTLVIFSADHGEEFWDHGGYQHGHTLYNELLHVPLIMRGPGLPDQPRVVDPVIRHIDLTATMVEMGGATLHADARGRSLVPLIYGRDEQPRSAFSEALFLRVEKKTVRQQNMKLIYDPFAGSSTLFDLNTDPQEKTDVAIRDAASLNRLKLDLLDWQRVAEAKFAALPRSAAEALDSNLTQVLRQGGY